MKFIYLTDFIDAIDPLLSQVEDIIHSLPQKGDKAGDCQRINLQQHLNELQAAVNGVLQKDLEDE